MTRRRRTAVVTVAVAALVTAANASQGAYFSQSWGWVALALLVPTTLALIFDVVEVPGRLRIAFAGLVVALGCWIALSALWSISPAGSVREVERVVVYVALALALAVVLRRGDAPGLTAGVFVGVVVVSTYSLATRLFQDVLETYDTPELPYRLSAPIGYWNSLGLLAVVGILLSLGLAAQARRVTLVGLAAAPLPVLASTLYFTFSRGAWAALGIGLVVVLAVDARRLRFLWATVVAAPASVVAVGLASRQDALTTEGAPIDDAVEQGHRLALSLALLVVATVALAVAARWLAWRAPADGRTRRIVDVALALVAAGAVALGIASLGGPASAASELRERFESGIEVRDPNDLNERLFSLSGNGRIEHIEVAWEAARERPIVGNGAGTYEYFWYLLRPIRFDVRDAHSLYAEMLAEVGIVGLALLLLALALPAVGAIRARRSRVAPAAFGGFAAWAVHSSIDWHWEVVGVTSAALLAGGACMLAGERRRGPPLKDAARVPALVGASVLSVAAVVSLVGNQALFAARDAARGKDWVTARDHAHRAEVLLPWSFEPLVVRGDAEAGLGDRAAALEAYRSAVSMDSENWVAWLRLAQVARGPERAKAYERVRELNPLEEDLPGEASPPGS